MRGRFVGRNDELETLARVLDRRAPVATRAALVIGQPGAGKSRLIGEALRRSGTVALRVTGYEPEQELPLTATRDLVTALARARRAGRRLRGAAFGTGGAGSSGHLALFESAYRCVVELAPMTIAVDDLQWMDSTSVGLITYLVRAGAGDGTSLSVLAAGRPAAATGAMRDSLAAILGPSLVEVGLGPLSPEAGRALARNLAPSLGPDEAERIWRAAGGSPFWIEALALEGGAFDAALDQRFARLGADAGALLAAIAVVGRPAEHRELTAALDWPAGRLVEALRELRARGLATEVAGTVEAAHDLVREAAARQIAPEASRSMHARLAGLLHRDAGDDVRRLLEALDHTRAAGRGGRALVAEIARAPTRRLLGASGLRSLAALAEDGNSGDPDGLGLSVEVSLAELASELGDRTLELERWHVVAGRAAEPTRTRALVAAAKAAYRLGRRDVAAGYVAEARRSGSQDRAAVIALDALESEILRWLDHRLPEARRLTGRALALARHPLDQLRRERADVDPHLRAACLDALYAGYDLALQDGSEVQQVAFATRLVELADTELGRLEAQLLLALAHRRSGRNAEAERLARKVHELANARVYPAVMVSAGHHLARALYNLARVAEAEEVAAEAERLSERLGETGRFLSEIRSLRPGIALSRGDWTTGLQRLRDDIIREPDPHYQLGIHEEIAVWLARLAGRSEETEIREQLRAARAHAEAVGCPRCHRELDFRSAEALARIGDVDGARNALRGRLGARTRHSAEARLAACLAIGALRTAADDTRRAILSLARLSRRLTAAGLHREALWADLDRARVLSSVDAGEAIRLYRSVAARAETGGVLTDLHLARRRLRELGSRIAPPRRAHGPFGLSARELDVARLAASGASNPEIAATLFVSRKTVERHISAALSKTGARNRTELATRLAQEGLRVQPEMREFPNTAG